MNNAVKAEQKQQLSSTNLHWIPSIFFKPRKTISEIVKLDKPVWLLPLLVLSVLVLVQALITAPIKKQAIEMGTNLPPDFQYYSQEMQTQFMEAQASQTSPLFLYVFPILLGIVGIWLSWFLTSSILHLAITLYGSRASNTKTYNLSAWSSIPFILRFLVQILALTFSKTLVSNPGLSGLLSSSSTGMMAFLREILGFIDIYFIFQVILLLLGIMPLSGLPKGKAWSATIITLIIVLLIKALPGLLSSVFSDLSLTGSFFF